MKPLSNVCFLWEDFLIQTVEKLGEEELILFKKATEYSDFNSAKESFKQCVYTNLSLTDTQEVWPEILECLEKNKNSEHKYKVWHTSKIIGFSCFK